MFNKKYKAFLFDLNGTMIDDMKFHTIAWHTILRELGADLAEEAVKKQMYGKNSELLVRVFGESKFSQSEMDELSVEKEKRYQSAFKPHLKLIDGLDGFLEKSHQREIKMAVCSAAIPFNIDFVLDGLNIRKYISCVVSADDVIKSKPDPETFAKAAVQFGLKPEECLVFEDVPKGVEAAARAGMDCIVITTQHQPEEFEDYKNILTFIADYNEPTLNDLL